MSSPSGPVGASRLDEKEFFSEALRIVETAELRKVYLRILGSLAVYASSLDKSDCIAAFNSLERTETGEPAFKDVDLAGYGKQKKEINKVFEDLKFRPDIMINALFGNRRLTYYHPRNIFHVDVFLDKLEFSHDVRWGDNPGSGRLSLDNPTLAAEDLVLGKLQIHDVSRRDLVDLVVLFIGHEVTESGGNSHIAGGYVASVLSEDWGFWYDATTNLSKVESLVLEFQSSGKLAQERAEKALGGIRSLKAIVERAPKTDKWKSRARAGTSKPWFREVEEVRK